MNLLLKFNRIAFYQAIVLSILICLTLTFASENLVAENITTYKTAADRALLNDRVKAAFILNIARYVEWPENSLHSEIRLCFLKQNPLGAAADNIRNKRIKIRPLEITTIPSLESDNDCNILFLTQQQMTTISTQLNNKTKNTILLSKNILIIGDLSENNVIQEKIDGVMIFLTRKKTRLGIEISRKVLTNSALKLSSELLKLSKIE